LSELFLFSGGRAVFAQRVVIDKKLFDGFMGRAGLSEADEHLPDCRAAADEL
jgi:hypothetical protein